MRSGKIKHEEKRKSDTDPAIRTAGK